MIRALAFVVAILCIGPAIAQPLPANLDKANAIVIDSTKGRIVIKLRGDLAPQHAERIKQLAREGYYNNVPFHRVMDGFMAQTGDGQNFNGTGGSKYPNLKQEFSKVPFTRGIVGMARRGDSVDTANSQFFIMFAEGSSLNGLYTVIGEVVSGMDVVDKLKKAAPGSSGGQVTDPDKMLKVQVASDIGQTTPIATAPPTATPPPAAPGSIPAGRRVALVIGNSSYKNMPGLRNPSNDAADVGNSLKGLGFDVIVATDLDRVGMNDAISRFARKVGNADIALVYYAGHGMQYAGRNYLLPTDANLEGVTDVNRFQLTPVDDLVEILAAAKGLQLVILDACRNNPVEREFKNRVASAPGGDRDAGSTRGFSRIEVRSGLLVTYATAANTVAADGDGRNSPFTRAFLDNVATPDLEIRQMLYKVQSDVYASTKSRQLPEISSLYVGPNILLKTTAKP
jgi:peptidylprolyl isomerase